MVINHFEVWKVDFEPSASVASGLVSDEVHVVRNARRIGSVWLFECWKVERMRLSQIAAHIVIVVVDCCD